MAGPTSPLPVGILGGMGPAAGADFARLFVEACARLLAERGQPVHDQAFPAHWLAQLPVPDRSDPHEVRERLVTLTVQRMDSLRIDRLDLVLVGEVDREQ